jgi:hypothetical protein
MGPNQFFNNDLKDRAIWLTLALGGSLGRHGGNIGSYAGNYKATVFGGIPLYVAGGPVPPADGRKRRRAHALTICATSRCTTGPTTSA